MDFRQSSIVLKSIEPQGSYAAEDAELDLDWVRAKSNINRATEKIRPRMIVAIALHLAPLAAAVHGTVLRNDVEIERYSERVPDRVASIIG